MLKDDRLETDTSGQHPQRPQDFCVQVDPRLDAWGRRQLVAGRWPRVTGLTSYLSGCFRFCSGVTCFFTPPH
jgi:hypothetical protein